MKHAGPVAALAALLSLGTSACADRDLNASIEKMNEGVVEHNRGDYDTAESKFAEATTLADQNHTAWYNLGQTREKIDKYKEAAEAFQEAAKHRPEDGMYQYRLGKALIGNECVPGAESNLNTAQTALEAAVKLNPRLYKAWYCLGQIYYLKDEPKRAAEAWTQSASLNPYEGKPFISLGQLYIRWDKLQEAISVLDNGRLNVKDPRDLSHILFSLGFAHEKQGNLDKAIEHYTAALEKSGSNIEARRQRGFAYANKGDKEKAKVDLEAFVKSGGGDNTFEVQAANERLLRMLHE